MNDEDKKKELTKEEAIIQQRYNEYLNRAERRFFIIEELANIKITKNPMTGLIERVPGILIELEKKFFLMNNAVQFANFEPLAKKDPIELFIDSPGGYVLPTLVFCDIMQKIQIPVYTIVLGRAYSGAGIIAISGEVGHRYILKDATIMLHEPAYGMLMDTALYGPKLEIEIAYAQMNNGRYDRRKLAKFLKKLNEGSENLIKLIKKHSQLTGAKIRKFLIEEKIFTAKEALEAGLVDKIVTAKTLANELGRTLIEITNDLPPTLK